MRGISLKYEMTTIVSIHQPNNDLFNMFDNIYVLAKGGVGVYLGPPSDLRQHLIDCQIECNRDQVPIEVMLKISTKEKENHMIENLVQKTKIDCKDIQSIQNMKEINSIQSPTKRFNFNDFYYLMMRTIASKYQYNWFEVMLKIGIYLMIAFMVKLSVSPELVIPDGCFELSLSMSCNQTLEDIRNEFLIKQNLRYHYYFILLLSLFVLVINSVNFSIDFRILHNQNRNGKFPLLL